MAHFFDRARVVPPLVDQMCRFEQESHVFFPFFRRISGNSNPWSSNSWLQSPKTLFERNHLYFSIDVLPNLNNHSPNHPVFCHPQRRKREATYATTPLSIMCMTSVKINEIKVERICYVCVPFRIDKSGSIFSSTNHSSLTLLWLCFIYASLGCIRAARTRCWNR